MIEVTDEMVEAAWLACKDRYDMRAAIEAALAAREPDNEDKLSRLRDHISNMFVMLDEVGYTIHPYVLEEVEEIARILKIDPSDIPTESREFARYGAAGREVR